MKIALVLDHFDRRRGGVETWTAQLADHLIAGGHELHIVADGMAETERREGLRFHQLPRAASRTARADAAATLLQRLDVDVIHDMGLGWYYDILQPHGGCRQAAARQNLALVPSWSRPPRRMAEGILPRYRDFQRLGDKQYADITTDRPQRLVVAISQMVARDLIQDHQLDESRLRSVSNGVDVERFSPALRDIHRSQTRRELELGEEPLFLLVAHNLRLKGLPVLIRAIRRLKRRGQAGVLAVVGGRRLGGWKRHCRMAGVAEHVRFVGPVADARPYYAAADIYVQPTWYDPCSLVLLEALACGLPVITTRFNGAGELIDPGVHGTILENPADAAALAGAMQQWSNRPRRQMAASLCRQRALAHSFEKNVAEILGLYDEVTACGANRRGAAA